MNDSIVYEGDYGTGDTRARDMRLKSEIGNLGRSGKNGYKFHSSLTVVQVATYLREWRRFPRRDKSWSW